MEILDGHIHIGAGPVEPEGLLERMKGLGYSGGLLISWRPPSFLKRQGQAEGASERLDNLFAWCGASPNLFPIFWIDPLEEGALGQVKLAVERGVMGFKVICGRHYPNDPQAMKVYAAIAEAGKPILFHSGILWDGQPSSDFNRPGNFECLMTIKNLRFTLAHISWPWCDELIAVYGKIINATYSMKTSNVEMFVDTTVGTPGIYRRDALTKLFTVGYPVENNVIFGTDGSAGGFGTPRPKELVDRDVEILKSLGLDDVKIAKVFGGNLRRFLGLVP